jgi:hypothetical protein
VRVAVVALHNLAVHRLLPSPTDAGLNLVTAAGLTALARRAGCSHDDLGLRAADAAAGLRLGLAAAAVATGVVVLAPPCGDAAVLPRPAGHRRRPPRGVYHLAVRIPLATALTEELASAAPCSASSGGDAHPPLQWHGPRCSSAPPMSSRP